MKRLYESIIQQHFDENEQMLFMAGPRQVGKTTLSKALNQSYPNFHYLSFDVTQDRKIILEGEQAVLNAIDFYVAHEHTPLLVLDEFHKYKHWKNFLKSLYDQFKSELKILVTGSAKLNLFKSGGDSLMGRYLLYRIHPLSVAELLSQAINLDLTHPQKQLDHTVFERLYHLGSYPDPFIRENERFSQQWRKLRRQQLFQEDIQTLKHVQDIPHIEMLANLLRAQVGTQLNYAKLASAVKVSIDTINRWLNVLEEFYYCFRIKPWHKNIKRSLLKEPKIFLWDWAEVRDSGAKVENFVACHLLKAVHFWTDYGLGEFNLFYLRDKEKRKVDFLITKNDEPWTLIEVKQSHNHGISKSLHYFKSQTQAPHAFQVVYDMPYVNKDCFSYTDPVIVPLITFLSQLV